MKKTRASGTANTDSTRFLFSGRAEFPADDYRGRLAFVSLLYFFLFLAGAAADIFFHPDGRAWQAEYWLDIAAMAVSLAIFLLTRSGISPRKLLNFGLAYQALGAFFISIGDMYLPIPEGMRINLISWACVWIAVFPIFVPAPFRKSVPASLAAASMGPLAYLAATALGRPALTPETLINRYLPYYLSAAISFFPIYVMTRLNRNLARAKRMGSYHLVSRLGEGGMGEVWKARHGLLARPAAVKMIKPPGPRSEGDAARRISRRFEREARCIAALRSPHTIALWDFGTGSGGALYYAMELLEGIDLQKLVEKFGPLEPERTVYLLRQACRSLEEAHFHGLVHRDIKPANLIVCRLGLECDFLKILDFGLARKAVQEEAEGMTREGFVAGTPHYIAPEILSGRGEIDGRADIYALGCVAYWLLTGRRVFEAASAIEAASHHLRTVPEPPSKRSELEIPEELDRLVLDCLEKDPERRIGSPRELENRLEGIGLERPWTESRAERWWRNHFPAPDPEAVRPIREEDER